MLVVDEDIDGVEVPTDEATDEDEIAGEDTAADWLAEIDEVDEIAVVENEGVVTAPFATTDLIPPTK